MAERDSMNSRAAAHVDQAHNEQRQAMFDQHRMQEQRELARRKVELHSFNQQRETVEERYENRTRQIEAGRQRVREKMDKRHNSMAGRLQAMTKAGRAKQQDERERLVTRAEQLHARAYNQYSNTNLRLQNNEQKARIGHAKELRQLHEQHWQYREEHTRRHQQTRPQQIEQRAQTMKQTADQQWQQAMKRPGPPR